MNRYPHSIVLLHGWGFDCSVWQPVMPLLKAHAEVIALDLPCFGESELCSDDIEMVCQNLLARMPEKCALLGWSLGGMIATYLAIHYPERVAALVTVGSNLKWVADKEWPGATPENFSAFYESLQQQFQSTKKHFCGVIARGDHQERSLAKQLCKSLSDSPLENYLSGLRLLNKIDNREKFFQLKMAGLHLLGEHDAMVPVALAQKLKTLNKHQRVKILAAVSHAPFLSVPESFVKTVVDFVQQQPYRINKLQVAQSFSKAASTYDSAAQLQRDIGDRLFTQLPKKSPAVVLDLGCGTGVYSEKLMEVFPVSKIISLDLAQGMLQTAHRATKCFKGVCADAEHLPFKDESINLIFSNLMIQWCERLDGLFFEINRVLQIGGEALITTFVDGTLHELQAAWQQVDNSVHVNQFVSLADLKASAESSGFEAVIEQRSQVKEYSRVQELTRGLKAIGAHNMNAGQPQGLTGRKKALAFAQAYESYRRGDKLPTTYQVAYLHLFKKRVCNSLKQEV